MLVVSIPVGFFQALQLDMGRGFGEFLYSVSIPVGFFQALQRDGSGTLECPECKFQSLSGFFRPCNQPKEDDETFDDWVSIPVGFFQALQPHIGP